MLNNNTPARHQLDCRADELIQKTEAGMDDLFDTRQLAAWLGVSKQFLEIGRNKGYGPRFEKLGPRCVRYTKEDVLLWLKERSHQRTSEYRRAAQCR